MAHDDAKRTPADGARSGDRREADKAREGAGKRTIDRKAQADDGSRAHEGVGSQGADKLRNLFRGNRNRG